MTLRARRADRSGTFSGNTPERAIIDIGSNTVRLVVYGGSLRAPTILLNEKVTARLGRDIAEAERIPDEAMDLAMRGLRRFALVLQDLEITDVETVATAAARDAKNGEVFLDQVRSLGFEPRLLPGEEEARLSANGVIAAFPGAQGLVADLGGGSLEIVRIADGQASDPSTLPIGTLRLPEYRGKKPGEMRKNLAKVLKKGGWANASKDPLYLVGGTWRSMAVYAMEARGHPLSDPHGFILSSEEAQELADTLIAADPEKLRESVRISTMRSESLPDAAALLQAVLKRLKPDRLVFSSWGLREGLLYDRLADHERTLDPLLAGLSVFATQRGAPPVLATRIAGWTVGAVPAQSKGSERLRLAATMLALASMQVEPNIRLDHARDWALHKRWIALEDEGRAMLAAAVAANRNHCVLDDDLRALAGEDCLEEAICWGLAIRLARRIGARSRKSLQVSRLSLEDEKLILRLAQSHGDLFGVPNEKDIKLLADRLGVSYDVQLVPDDQLLPSDDGTERLATAAE